MPSSNQQQGIRQVRQGDALPSIVRHISQEKINLYAEATRDFNPIHIDESFAAQTPLGGTIAHGMLCLAYVSEMMTAAFGKKWTSGGKLSVRFKTPARPRDTITTSGRINSIEHKEEHLYASCSISAHNQKGETIIIGEAIVEL